MELGGYKKTALLALYSDSLDWLARSPVCNFCHVRCSVRGVISAFAACFKIAWIRLCDKYVHLGAPYQATSRMRNMGLKLQSYYPN